MFKIYSSHQLSVSEGENGQGGTIRKAGKTERQTGLLPRWPWSVFEFHFHEVTQCTSDLAGLTLTEHKWVWRLRVYVPMWADAEGLSYLFIIKGWQLMKRSAAPPFTAHRLIMSLLRTYTRMLQERDLPLYAEAFSSVCVSVGGWSGAEQGQKGGKKKSQRSRLVGSKKDRGREVWLRRRGARQWNEKIEGVMDGRGGE